MHSEAVQCALLSTIVSMSISIPALIEKKRDGLVLSEEEIYLFIKSVVNGSMKDSQIGK